MNKYREIIRLQGLRFSERNIAQSCNVTRKTVSKVLHIIDRVETFMCA